MARGTTETTSVVPSLEVRAEARESEQSATALVAPSIGAQSRSSFPSLSNVGPPTIDRGKAPMASEDDAVSEGHVVYFDLQVPVDESVLANSVLIKRLCQVTLLPVDRKHRRKRSVVEIFSSFYPTIIGLIHDMSDLEVGYTKFADIRSVWKNKVAAVDAEKVAALEQLKSAAEREAKL
uniref:Uncharacterized protein LOC114914086 n=1 Tax=Elaeis guineensis var. tenera TaxID=51953 RepID=A0A8N4EVR0_ELAGV|nr:uncharacterized protein LOC114914086 [Elaeis guineensis]